MGYRDLDGWDPDQPVPEFEDAAKPSRDHESRRKVVAVAILVAVLCALTAWRLTSGQTDEGPVATAPAASVTPTAQATVQSLTPSATATPSTSPSTSASVSDEADPRLMVQAFTTAWARPALDAEAWLEGIEPHVTADFYRKLTTTDPTNVPATKITGPVQEVTRTGTTGEWSVPTDGGVLLVSAQEDGGDWKATSIEPYMPRAED